MLTLAVYQTDKPQYKFFDAQTETLFKKLTAKLPGYDLALQGSNRDENKFIVAAYNDRTPGSRYLYDAASGHAEQAGRPEPVAAGVRHGARAADQLPEPRRPHHPRIPDAAGWPRSEEPGVHRQSARRSLARDGGGYNPEVQFLANRGFCVLQMNFRGSTGYGRRFWEAGFGQWGLKMQDDISDGVAWLVKQGIADPKRVGIYGASYGGYATLAGVAFTPDLYAAAVDYVGVSNLFTFMQTIPPYWKPMLAKMQDMVGDPVRDKDRLAATSPALHADRIKTPLFVAQGAKDPRVNKDESDQMVKALKARGVNVEYMVKDNEGHGFHNDENKFEFYEAMEKFLLQHLKP